VFTVTGTAQKDAWDRDVLPPVERVRPVPIPNNPLRYVLVYALELDSGVALVDAGWPTDDAWDALNAGLVEAGGTMADVEAVVVTHLHPDHYGLAGRVREASGAWVGLHPADAKLLDTRYHDTDGLIERMRELLEMSGVPEDKLPDLNMASMEIKSTLNVALPDKLIEDHELLDLAGWDFRAVWTPGHSPGHICLHSDQHRLLLSGDHVLPRITPTSRSTPSSSPTRWATTSNHWPRSGPCTRTRCSQPMNTVSPGWTSGSTCSRPTMPIA
jgi:glyoxylase-like metal-dependent hydrolase (beta-lactamase superfamily II)